MVISNYTHSMLHYEEFHYLNVLRNSALGFLRAFLRTRVNGRVNGFRMIYACARNRVAYHLLDEKTKFGKIHE